MCVCVCNSNSNNNNEPLWAQWLKKKNIKKQTQRGNNSNKAKESAIKMSTTVEQVSKKKSRNVTWVNLCNFVFSFFIFLLFCFGWKVNQSVRQCYGIFNGSHCRHLRNIQCQCRLTVCLSLCLSVCLAGWAALCLSVSVCVGVTNLRALSLSLPFSFCLRMCVCIGMRLTVLHCHANGDAGTSCLADIASIWQQNSINF